VSTPPDPALTADCQALISDAEFAALFAPPRLRALLPPVGAAGVDPVLWLATLPRRHGALRQERWRLPGLRFDHVAARPLLLAELGAQAAQRRL
jgi:hypothetical protein